jgi:hypothetical protein
MAKWESTQRALDNAMDAETAAARRLAELASQISRAERGETRVLAEPAPAGPTDIASTAHESAPRESRSSQSFVLAALIIALLAAAVASVKLARASDDSVFAGADDAAAALSLPVVGVIPATTHAVARGSLFGRYRALTLLAQMLLAVAVFAAVAYIVQSPALRF